MSTSIFSVPRTPAGTAAFPLARAPVEPTRPDSVDTARSAPLGQLANLPSIKDKALRGFNAAQTLVNDLIHHLLTRSDFKGDAGLLTRLGQALARECGKPAGEAFSGPPPEALREQMEQALRQMQQMIQALHLMGGADRVPCAQACQACCGGGGCGSCCSASAWNAACQCAGSAQCGNSCWTALGTACGCCGNACAQGWGRPF